jgi:hypothetical protein
MKAFFAWLTSFRYRRRRKLLHACLISAAFGSGIYSLAVFVFALMGHYHG